VGTVAIRRNLPLARVGIQTVALELPLKRVCQIGIAGNLADTFRPGRRRRRALRIPL